MTIGFLTLSLIVGTLGGAGSGSAASSRLTYDDVAQDASWALAPVAEMVQRGIFTGYEDGTFRANRTLSRIEALTAVVRFMGLRAEAEATAADVKLKVRDASSIPRWAIGYVAVAEREKLLGESEMRPTEAASRLWVATLLVKAAGLDREARGFKEAELPFTDAEKIPSESIGYVAVATDRGLVGGYEDGTFRPAKAVSRAEIAALLDRAGALMTEAGGELVEIADATIGDLDGMTVTLVKNGASQPFTLADEATVVRKSRLADADALVEGDKGHALVRVKDSVILHLTITSAATAPKPSENDTVSGDGNGTAGGGSTSNGGTSGGGASGNTGGDGTANGSGSSGAGQGSEDASAGEYGRYGGEVLKIVDNELTINLNGVSKTLQVAADVEVVFNGEIGEWSNVRRGDYADAVVTEGKVTHLTVVSDRKIRKDFDGYISSVNRGQIVIAKNGQTMMYNVDEEAKLRRDGDYVDVEELQPGDRVEGYSLGGLIYRLKVTERVDEEDDDYWLKGTYMGHTVSGGEMDEVYIRWEIEGNPIDSIFPVVEDIRISGGDEEDLDNGVTRIEVNVEQGVVERIRIMKTDE